MFTRVDNVSHPLLNADLYSSKRKTSNFNNIFHFCRCQLLAFSRNIVVATYYNTFFFCFIWRVVLIRYSDRGLVLNGRPNTQLLNKLHWVTFTSFVSINILHFPIQKVISGTFEETISGKVCLLETFTLVNEVSRKTFMGAQMFPFIVNLFNIYWSYKVRPTFFTTKVFCL